MSARAIDCRIREVWRCLRCGHQVLRPQIPPSGVESFWPCPSCGQAALDTMAHEFDVVIDAASKLAILP